VEFHVVRFAAFTLTSVLVHSWPVSLVTMFLCLPVYMIHQYEEHDNDRFRLFVNQKIGKRRVGLSPLAVFVINVTGVCGVIGLSLALAARVSAGFGLVAVYLVLLNGTIHAVQAVISRATTQDWELRSSCFFRWADTVSRPFSGLVVGLSSCT
jgi:Protein of unknown function with HXXEE motif